MKKFIIGMFALIFLSGCQIVQDQAVEAAGIGINTYAVSSEVDLSQAVLGKYSDNQDTLAEVDALQEDIISSLNGPQSLIDSKKFYVEAKRLYAIMSEEVKERDAELSVLQKGMLKSLDSDLRQLEERYLSFTEDSIGADLVTMGAEIVSILGTAATLVKVGAAL